MSQRAQNVLRCLFFGPALVTLVACGQDSLGSRLDGAPDFLDRDTGEPCTPDMSSLTATQALGDNSDDESSDQIDCREDGNSGAGDDRAGCSPDGTDLDQGGSSDGDQPNDGDDADDGDEADDGDDQDAADEPLNLSDNCDAMGCCEVS